MENKVRHDGVVQSIQGNHVTVQIVQTSACAACGARNACNAAESQRKTVDAWVSLPAQFSVGDRVSVVGTYRASMKATFLAFGLPLLLLLASVFVNRLIIGELPSVVLALAILAVYYFILWLVRERLNKQFIFTLEKDTPSD